MISIFILNRIDKDGALKRLGSLGVISFAVTAVFEACAASSHTTLGENGISGAI